MVDKLLRSRIEKRVTNKALWIAALCVQLMMAACGRDQGRVMQIGTSPDGSLRVLRQTEEAYGGGLGKSTVRVFILNAHERFDSEVPVLDAIRREHACIGLHWAGNRELVILYRGLETSTFRNVRYLPDQGHPGAVDMVEIMLVRSAMDGDGEEECVSLDPP